MADACLNEQLCVGARCYDSVRSALYWEMSRYWLCNQRLKSQAEWRKITEGSLPSVPSLYRGTFTIDDKPKDTFLYMKGWTKGVVFINGHNLGRYWDLGPQETLYLPSPWLRKGHNELLVFELHKCESPSFSFVTEPKIIGDPIYRY